MNESDQSDVPRREPLAIYQQQLKSYEDIAAHKLRQWKLGGTIRGSLFLCSLCLFALGFVGYSGINTTWFIASGILLLAFLVVAFIHVRIEEELFRKRLEIEFTRTSIAQLERNWKHMPIIKVNSEFQNSPLAIDLDLVGTASLLQLTCSAETPIGQQQFVAWMLELSEIDQIRERQQAAREMGGWHQHRDQLRLLGRLITTQHSDPSKFMEWATRGHDGVAGAAMIWFARGITVYHLTLLMLLAVQLIPLAAFTIGLIVGLALNFLLTVVIAGRIHDVFNQVAAQQQDARHYLTLFKLISEAKPQSEFLRAQQTELIADTISALSAFTSLERRTWLANLRRNGLFYFVYLAVQFLFLWDVHALVLLRNWRARFGKYVPQWFAAVAQWEAIASLGKIAADHPTWTFPVIGETPKSEATFRASQLGHPLLRDDLRVSNDVNVGPPGSILLVTGSNMSGKSTLLRSIGLNIVLAQMGTVVCARELTMPCIDLQTSIRIQDSLADGVSYYFAELKRLKQVVSAARTREHDQTHVLLYLLDEILQGTNSRERQIAVSKVLEHLVDSRAIGAISTHDLELATAEKLAKSFQPVHFRETITTEAGVRKMTFDYRMRQGVATTTNALELLRIVGLDD